MDSSRIINTYLSDGTKLRSEYYANVATAVVPLGLVCEQEDVRTVKYRTDFCGVVRYDVAPDSTYRTMLRHTAGYTLLEDESVIHFAYQTDYHGNVANVWQMSDSLGTLLEEPLLVQNNRYLADGTLHGRASHGGIRIRIRGTNGWGCTG